jgi:FKBP-type peptidyl-prolyl cis-trans isomerase FklB
MLRAIVAAVTCLTLIACEQDVMKEIDAKIEARKAAAEAQAEAGRTFLQQNATKAGVQTTPSGLQYEVVRAVAADLPKPEPTDRVLVNYEGKLIDGKVFDSSYERGEPIGFVLNQVIAGWTEGLQLMKPGEEYNFYIPAEIGYGPQAQGEDIPANSTLIFRVELLGFQKPDGTTVNAPGLAAPPAK